MLTLTPKISRFISSVCAYAAITMVTIYLWKVNDRTYVSDASNNYVPINPSPGYTNVSDTVVRIKIIANGRSVLLAPGYPGSDLRRISMAVSSNEVRQIAETLKSEGCSVKTKEN